MDKMADVLGRVGAWCGQNKYLSAIKNAFQNFMPLTIAGALGVLWCSVIVNAESGLGVFFKPIMALEFINPAFDAIRFATIDCITISVTFGIAQEIGTSNGESGYFPGLLGLGALLTVTDYSSGAIPINAFGATGLFTGIIIGILVSELFGFLRRIDGLKIKMPEQVPPAVAHSFEVLIPACIVLITVSGIGTLIHIGTGLYMNDLISTYVQGPLSGLGATLPGVIIIYLLMQAFWLVGIHGNNVLEPIREALFTPLILQNINTFSVTQDAYSDKLHIFSYSWIVMFGQFGGAGCTIALIIAIFIFSKREDNRSIATLSLVPGLFNINETVTFGIPMVLNPILGIPYVLTPIITLILGYVLTIIGFCPKGVLNTPWTTPPILNGFLTTGGNIMGAVSQGIVLVVAVAIYAPFLIAYEKYQNKQSEETA